MKASVASACVLTLIVAGSVSSGCRRDPVASARAFAGRGDAYAAEGRLREAVIEYRNALQQRPGEADLHYRLALLYERLDEGAAALRHYQSAVERDPRHAGARVRLGEAALARGDLQDAERAAARVLDDEPRHVRALVLRGRALAALDHPQEARRHADEALALDPASASAHHLRGLLDLAEGRPADAQAAFERAVAVAREDERIAAHLALADYLAGAGRLADAVRALDGTDGRGAAAGLATVRRAAWTHALGAREAAYRLLEPLYHQSRAGVSARMLAARLLVADSGDLDEALAHADAALTRAPESAAAYYVMGLVRMARGEIERGEKALAHAQQLEPQAAPVQLELARAAARRALTDAITRLPERADLYEARARLHVAMRSFALALEDYEAASRRAPHRAEPIVAAGLVREQIGDTAGARDAFERALSIDPGAGVGANNLAWIYAADGRIDEALQAALRARRSLDDAPTVLHTLGWMYHLAGRQAQAVPLLERAAARQPQNARYARDLRTARGGL